MKSSYIQLLLGAFSTCLASPHPKIGDETNSLPSSAVASRAAPKWIKIDDTARINNVITVTSSSGVSAANDGLYIVRPTGQIQRYINSAWTTVDNYEQTYQIAGANGNLWQRHLDGGTFRWLGQPGEWESTSGTDTSVYNIVAAGDQLFAQRKDGSVARLSDGAWVTIDQPPITDSSSSTQILFDDELTMWNRLYNGTIVRTPAPYNAGQWKIVDSTYTAKLAVGGNNVYRWDSSANQVRKMNATGGWTLIDSGRVVNNIYAVGDYLYVELLDGSYSRYSGTPMLWETIDQRASRGEVAGDRKGGLWRLMGGGQIWEMVV